MNFGGACPSRSRMASNAVSSATSRPSLILTDFDETDAEASEDRDRGEVRGSSDDDRVAFIEQHSADEVDGVLRAVRDEHVLARGGDTVSFQLLDDARAELGQAGSWCVLQRLGAIGR